MQDALDSLLGEQSAEEKAKREAVQAAMRAAEDAKKKELEEKLVRLKAWDGEEVRLLEKALVKFPPGTSKRWEQVRAGTDKLIFPLVQNQLQGVKIFLRDAQLISRQPLEP